LPCFFGWLLVGDNFLFTVELDCQSFPSPGPSPVDDPPTRLGGHPFSETVISGSFYFARLKCSFHFL
jgi:hypothetical protein